MFGDFRLQYCRLDTWVCILIKPVSSCGFLSPIEKLHLSTVFWNNSKVQPYPAEEMDSILPLNTKYVA